MTHGWPQADGRVPRPARRRPPLLCRGRLRALALGAARPAGDSAVETVGGSARRNGAVIAALYVQTGGVYYGLDDVDPWDEVRDARLYPGPWPVVAHPPCARWSRTAALTEA